MTNTVTLNLNKTIAAPSNSIDFLAVKEANSMLKEGAAQSVATLEKIFDSMDYLTKCRNNFRNAINFTACLSGQVIL